MEKNRGVKVIAVVALIVAVIGLTIAYASLSTTLNISNTQAKVASATWKVKFDNLQEVEKKGLAEYTAPTLEDTTLKDLNVTLKAPGDKVTIKFDVKNEGDIDAVLTTLTKKEVDELQFEGTEPDQQLVKSHLKYTLTCDGTELKKDNISQQNVKLSKTDGSKTFILTIEYGNEATQLPTAEVQIKDLDFSMIFSQDNDAE